MAFLYKIIIVYHQNKNYKTVHLHYGIKKYTKAIQANICDL